MTDERWFLEFDGDVDGDGRIVIPAKALGELPARFGSVHVRLSGLNPLKELIDKGVTHEEIDTIAQLQSSQEADVYRALFAEGKLKGTAFSDRMPAKLRGREP